MGTLQKLFDSALAEAINPKRICTKIITRKLNEQGIILTEGETSELEAELEEKFTEQGIYSNEEQLSQLEDIVDDLEPDNPILWSAIVNKQGKEVRLNISQKEYIAEANRIIEKISDQKLISSLVDEYVNFVLPRLESHNSSILQELIEQQEIFQERLKDAWGRGLDLLRTIIGICLEAGDDFNDSYAE